MYLHAILREEIEIMGAKNVVLLGLSQGCATSLVSALLWEGEAFGGVVGMCGWLPFRKGMLAFLEDKGMMDGYDEEVDIFERVESDDVKYVHEEGGQGKLEKAADWLLKELRIANADKDITKPVLPIRSIPVFLGHGKNDEEVPWGLGKGAAEFLDTIGMATVWKEYDRLDHWFSEDMLQDVVEFLKGLPGWEDTIGPESDVDEMDRTFVLSWRADV